MFALLPQILLVCLQLLLVCSSSLLFAYMPRPRPSKFACLRYRDCRSRRVLTVLEMLMRTRTHGLLQVCAFLSLIPLVLQCSLFHRQRASNAPSSSHNRHQTAHAQAACDRLVKHPTRSRCMRCIACHNMGSGTLCTVQHSYDIVQYGFRLFNNALRAHHRKKS